jgi:hypothetical protein
MAELVQSVPESDLSSPEALAMLDALRQEEPDFSRFLSRRGTRLPAVQQRAFLRLVQAAQATDYIPLLQQWRTHPTLSIETRALAVSVLKTLGASTDSSDDKALQRTSGLLQKMRTQDPLTDEGALQAPWHDEVLDLSPALVLEMAHALTADYPQRALAVLRTLEPTVQGQDRLALIDHLATIPLSESASTLQDMLAENADKAVQKAVKKALHRLKALGVHIAAARPGGHAVVGTVTHRLEKCLATHIDAEGNRVLWMIRTKPFGGYHIAYIVINYGTGIQYAVGLSATKRELPELLDKAQEHTPLIELEPTYCQFQLAQAQQMNLDSGTPVPEAYFALRDIVGETNVTFDKAIIYAALSEEDVQAAETYAERAQDLLDLPEFAGWTLPNTIVQKYGDQLRDLEESQIIVSEAIRRERVATVYEEATEEVLGEASRRLMRLRLEEMAYYLLQTGRRQEALWAIAAAKSMADDDPTRLRHNPFAGALLQRSLESAKQRPSSQIIMPYTRSAQPASPAPSSRIII